MRGKGILHNGVFSVREHGHSLLLTCRPHRGHLRGLLRQEHPPYILYTPVRRPYSNYTMYIYILANIVTSD
jgi:hypothetical protein